MSEHTMKKLDTALQSVLNPLAAAILLALPFAVQAAGPVVPGAGSILQQIQPATPPAPSSGDTGLQIQPRGSVPAASEVQIPVKTILIHGNTVFPEATLHSLVQEGEGHTLTLAQLDKLAARVTSYYRAHGYPLARAVIPAQTIRDGEVVIEVIEARYGKVSVDNHSRVNDRLLQATVGSLRSGQPVAQAPLDHDLLLLSDIPGVSTSAVLKPGQEVGTSDLLIRTNQTATVAGNAEMDNNGSRYTGRGRLGATIYLLDPFHHGDVLSITGLSSGSGMNYGKLNYETLLDGRGTRLGGSYSALHYILGDSLADVGGHGTASVDSLWLRQPLVRSRFANVYGQIQFDEKTLRDEIDVSQTHTNRHLDNWSATLSGDTRDGFLAGGINTWSMGATAGHVRFDDANAKASDAASAQTGGSFVKWTAELARLQQFDPRNSMYVNLSGQWANTNLDSAEQMVAGGTYTVRAYDMGVLSGDSGYLARVELRHNLSLPVPGQWQAIVFADTERITVNVNPWVTGVNEAHLSGAGGGLNWSGYEHWNANLYLAKPIGATPELLAGASRSTRCWVQVSRNF
jgi:hemolysin activation/secretion protein